MICLPLDEVRRAHMHRRDTRKVTLRVYQSQLGYSEHNDCNHNEVQRVLEHRIPLVDILLHGTGLLYALILRELNLSVVVQKDRPALQKGVQLEHYQGEAESCRC